MLIFLHSKHLLPLIPMLLLLLQCHMYSNCTQMRKRYYAKQAYV